MNNVGEKVMVLGMSGLGRFSSQVSMICLYLSMLFGCLAVCLFGLVYLSFVYEFASRIWTLQVDHRFHST